MIIPHTNIGIQRHVLEKEKKKNSYMSMDNSMCYIS